VTVEEARALPTVISVEVAGGLIGWKKTAAYQAVRDGRWPKEIAVIDQPGRRWKVRTADVLRYLGIEPFDRGGR
jgi:hypothetical protein